MKILISRIIQEEWKETKELLKLDRVQMWLVG
jgi:hypothetical protein